MSSTVALLRGINVGGHRKLPMAELRELCEGLGWAHVKTYIASGNVWFDSAEAASAEELATAIRHRYGYDVPVVLRSLAALKQAQAASPFREEAEAVPTSVHLAFLSALPDPAAVAALDADRSPGDRFVVLGEEVHIHFGGPSHTSKLTMDWLEKQLGVRATARNWRSVSRLAKGP